MRNCTNGTISDDYCGGVLSKRFVCGDTLQINTFDLLLTGDVPASTLECRQLGKVVIFRLKQDERGGHRFTWPPNVKGAEAISLEPGAVTQQMFLFDGENAWPLAPAWTSAKPPEPPANHMAKVEASDGDTPAARSEKRKWLK